MTPQDVVNPFEAPGPKAPPPPSPDDPTLASPGERIGAALLDGLFGGLLLLPAGGLWLMGYTEGALLALGLMIFGAYLPVQGYLVAHRGQSLGKIALNLKIVRNDGGDVGFYDGFFVRTMAFRASTRLPYVGRAAMVMDTVMLFTQRDHRTLHDLLAGTRVVRLPR